MTSNVIGILDCDELAPELKPVYQNYGVMFTQLLQPISDEWSIQTFRVVEGVFPEEISQCDAYLITGSKAGVYETHSWLQPMRELIKQAYSLSIPLVGICFGHQLLADTLGGKASKSTKGWGVGIRSVFSECVPAWQAPFTQTLKLLYSHQDQVLSLPPDAINIYGDSFCPHAAFYIDNKVLAFQGHPEFTHDYMKGLMRLRKDRYAEGKYDSALASLQEDHDGKLVAKWIFDFLEHSLNKRTGNSE